MSRVLPILVAVIFPFATTGQVFSPFTIDTIVSWERKGAAGKLEFRETAGTDDYNLTYMRAEWTVDPAVYFISGKLTYYFEAKTDLHEFIIDLSDSLQVCTVTFRNTSFDVQPSANQLAVSLSPFFVAKGTSDSISICYSGKPESTGLGSFVQSGHSGDSIIYTLSEPYGASDWFPCKNSLTDKVDSCDILLTIPPETLGGSNGRLIRNEVDGNSRFMHWRHRYPIATYLIGIAVTRYFDITEYGLLESGDTVVILNYLYPEDTVYYEYGAATLISMLRLYSDLFGDYPFKDEKYGHAQWNYVGGMEHQTMSFVYFPDIFELAAHELAHQWFGNKVTCGSWSDIWLNEGFATYLSGLCYENLAPEYWYAFKTTQQSRALKDSIHSVFCDDTTDVSRIFSGSISYAKAAYLLHMLRYKMGDDLFFDAVYNYIQDPLLEFGFARTGDLKKHLEDAYGGSLDEFFNDWFYGSGYPSYQLTWGRKNDGTIAMLVSQKTNNESVGFFEMPLPVLLKGADADTLLRLENTSNDQQYVLGPFPFRVDSVIFDPELMLLSQRNTVFYEESLASEVLVFPNPADEQITLNWFNREAPLETVLIYDLAGRLLCTVPVQPAPGPVYTLDVSNISNGMYLVVCRDIMGNSLTVNATVF